MPRARQVHVELWLLYWVSTTIRRKPFTGSSAVDQPVAPSEQDRRFGPIALRAGAPSPPARTIDSTWDGFIVAPLGDWVANRPGRARFGA